MVVTVITVEYINPQRSRPTFYFTMPDFVPHNYLPSSVELLSLVYDFPGAVHPVYASDAQRQDWHDTGDDGVPRSPPAISGTGIFLLLEGAMSRSSRILETLHSPVACYQRPHGQQIADTQDFGAANVRGAARNESLRSTEAHNDQPVKLFKFA